jgi:hypothetical protein
MPMVDVENDVTVEEILSLLKQTSLPTILVEGSDDIIVYRTFEKTLSHLGVSVFPVGGREKLLKVFLRKAEIPTSVKLVFIADQDVWVNTNIPPEFQDSRLLFTFGYSIENDVYIDGELWGLLSDADFKKYYDEIIDLIEWYALALARHLQDPQEEIKLHPNRVLNPIERQNLLALRPSEIYPMALRDQIAQDYQRLLRGKTLLKLFVRNTNSRVHRPRHSEKALLEMVALRPGTLLKTIRNKVEEIFQSTT